jgi:hypothetical protein
MEKDAAGCPSLPSHYGLTNPGTSRTSPAAYLTTNDAQIGPQGRWCHHGLGEVSNTSVPLRSIN